MTRTLSRPQRIAWARLAQTPRIGPLRFHPLLARFKSQAAARLSPRPIHIKDLAHLLGAPAGAFAAALTELDLSR